MLCTAGVLSHSAQSIQVAPALPDPCTSAPEPLEGAVEFCRALGSTPPCELTDAQRKLLGEADRLIVETSRETTLTMTAQERADNACRRSRADQILLRLADGMTTPSNLLLPKCTGADLGLVHSLPGDTGSVLVRIHGLPGPARFAVTEVDLGKIGESDTLPDMAFQAFGTTWLLVKVANAPVGLSRFYLKLYPDWQRLKPVFYPLQVRSPAQGTLDVTLVGPDGTTVPAMVRLTDEKSGLNRMPGGALNLAPLARDLRGPESRGSDKPEAVRAAGDLAGWYWCVPGRFAMAIPEGRWQVHVLRGPEWKPVRDTVEVSAGLTTRRQIRLERWTDMTARGWYSGDDHVHARIMSDDDADRLLTWAEAADVHVVSVLRMGNLLRTFYEQRGFGPAFRTQRGTRVLVPGQEDPRFNLGHAIGLNLTAPVRDTGRYLDTSWVADQIHAQGGLYGHAHVSSGLFAVHYDMTVMAPEGKADFGEILQSGILGTDLYFEFLNLGFRLAASAGSDTPYNSSLGDSRVYAWIGDQPFSAGAWFDALKNGHTFVSNGPMVEFTVDGKMPGDAITVTTSSPLRAKARAWGLRGYSAPATLEILRFGDAVKVARPATTGTTELNLDTELDPGFGCWIAARVTGGDGSAALTTPVYVTRAGFRPWDATRAPRLLEKRLANLDSLEASIIYEKTRLDRGRFDEGNL